MAKDLASQSGGTIELVGQVMTDHTSPSMTKLCDRLGGEIKVHESKRNLA